MKSEELIPILKGIPVFKGLDEAKLSMIVPLLRHASLPAGKLIIQEGTSGESMYIIKNGSVKVTRSQADGDELLLSMLPAGAFFGELSLIDNLPRSASVTSVEDTEIFELSKADFDRLLSEEIVIAMTFYRNCLNETFSRFRNAIANYAFSQHDLRLKSERLAEIDKDLSFAHKIQNYFITSGSTLGSTDRLHPNIRYSFIYDPCIEVGGDFFNIVKLDDARLGVIIADVEGHGVTASLATGILKSAFSILSREHGTDPASLVRSLNDHFSEVLSRRLFATAYYLMIDTWAGEVSFVKAGHHPPLFWRNGEQCFCGLAGKGAGLGMIRETVYDEVRHRVGSGDKILLYTDGIIEQMNPAGEMYGFERIEQKTRELILQGSASIAGELHRDLMEFAAGSPIADDITLLLIEFD